jgi:hypothetical protein
MGRRNHQVLLQKKGQRYQHVLVTGGSVINLSQTENSGHSDTTSNNIETVAQQALIQPQEERSPPEKTKEDVLAEINKRFSAFTSSDSSIKKNNKRFRFK